MSVSFGVAMETRWLGNPPEELIEALGRYGEYIPEVDDYKTLAQLRLACRIAHANAEPHRKIYVERYCRDFIGRAATAWDERGYGEDDGMAVIWSQ